MGFGKPSFSIRAKIHLNNLPKTIRVAAYYRCSTDGQEHSIPGQRRTVRRYIERKGWVLAGEYEDKGKSGASFKNRPGLNRLLLDAAAGLFDVIIFYDVCRLCRGGIRQFWKFVEKIDVHGVLAYCCELEKFAVEETAPAFNEAAARAREENIKRSRNATRGMYQSIHERGQTHGCRPASGFDQMRTEISTGKQIERVRFMDDGTRQILSVDGSTLIRTVAKSEKLKKDTSLRTDWVAANPESVELIRRIIRSLRTMGPKSLARQLNREGISSPKGGKWCPATLRYMGNNTAYIGVQATGKTSKGRYYRLTADGEERRTDIEDDEEKLVKRPESEWTIRENKYQSLVDEEEFEETREAARRRREKKTWNRKSHNQDRVYTLGGGFIKCDCGGNGRGDKKTRKDKDAGGEYVYWNYTCSEHRKYSSEVCEGFTIPMDQLDEYVLGEVRPNLTTPECLAALEAGLEAEFTRLLEPRNSMTAEEVKEIKAKLTNIEQKRRALVDDFDGTPEAKKFMAVEAERLVAEAEGLKRKLQQAKATTDKTAIKKLVEKGAALYLERMVGSLDAAESGERLCVSELKELLRLLDVQLTYHPEQNAGELTFSAIA